MATANAGSSMMYTSGGPKNRTRSCHCSGEPPVEAARREMNEELGLSTVQWVEFGTLNANMDHRHDTIHLFRAELTDGESLTMDPGELAAIRWFARSQLPSDLRPYVIPILRRAPAVGS